MDALTLLLLLPLVLVVGGYAAIFVTFYRSLK